LSLVKYSDGNGRLVYRDNSGEGSKVYKTNDEIGLSLDYSGTELTLLHGLTNAKDSVYYSGQGQVVSAGISAGGGNVSVNSGSQQMSMSGNSTGTVGNAYYKDETGEFTMFGDQQNKLGSVDLTSGSNTIVSSTTPDSSSVKMNMSGLEIEGFSSVDRGVLKILDGTDELSVDANLNDETGSLVINQGDVRVEASGDKINKTGSFIS